MSIFKSVAGQFWLVTIFSIGVHFGCGSDLAASSDIPAENISIIRPEYTQVQFFIASLDPGMAQKKADLAQQGILLWDVEEPIPKLSGELGPSYKDLLGEAFEHHHDDLRSMCPIINQALPTSSILVADLGRIFEVYRLIRFIVQGDILVQIRQTLEDLGSIFEANSIIYISKPYNISLLRDKSGMYLEGNKLSFTKYWNHGAVAKLTRYDIERAGMFAMFIRTAYGKAPSGHLNIERFPQILELQEKEPYAQILAELDLDLKEQFWEEDYAFCEETHKLALTLILFLFMHPAENDAVRTCKIGKIGNQDTTDIEDKDYIVTEPNKYTLEFGDCPRDRFCLSYYPLWKIPELILDFKDVPKRYMYRFKFKPTGRRIAEVLQQLLTAENAD